MEAVLLNRIYKLIKLNQILRLAQCELTQLKTNIL